MSKTISNNSRNNLESTLHYNFPNQTIMPTKKVKDKLVYLPIKIHKMKRIEYSHSPHFGESQIKEFLTATKGGARPQNRRSRMDGRWRCRSAF